ncbi:MAG: efflux RND transporter permease subunit [Acidobacteriota bacterium]|jgi:HAE1 family hydrophobic/amphiphilic exporter-1|nr:efflux RND transporter permease subunit [Acidobacteriota bacterium]
MVLSDLSVKQPVFATMMMVALVVLGIFSYRELSVDLFPDVDLPVVTVQTTYPGVAPETVETEVTKRIEEAINPIEGVKHITSTTTEGISVVVTEFELGTDIHTAAQDVRSKVSALRRDFPAGVDEPVIDRMDPGDLPVISLSVASPELTHKELTSLTEKVVKKRLENIEGVGSVKIIGGQRREIEVYLDPARLKTYGLTVPEVVQALASENIEIPAGKVQGAAVEELVRVEGKAVAPEDFDALIVKNIQGVPIRLGEVARVEDGYEEQRTLALDRGERALALEIRKQSGGNTVDVAESVKAEIPRLNQELPGGARLGIVKDSSQFIRESVDDVQSTLVLGALFTVFIVYLFLNSWRSTVITGLTLPVSIISSFIVMGIMDFSLNILTLLGLSLSVGLLIDDAIVVRENIVRHMQFGKDHFEAAREGTSEIGLAVMATTFSIIAVFVPIAFMKGIVGRFFFEFGITVAFAVMVSLFVSFTMDPMLSSRWYDPATEAGAERRGLSRLLEAFDRRFVELGGVYEKVIAAALRHRLLVVGAAALFFAGGLAVFGSLGQEFMPGYDRGEFQVSFKAASGNTIEQTEAIANEIAAAVAAKPGVDYVFTTIGAGESAAINEGSVYVKLKDKGARALTDDELRGGLRRDLASYGRAITSIEDVPDLGDARPVQLSVQGPDMAVLDELSAEVVDAIAGVPGAVDLDRSLDRDKPELLARIDRRVASDLGVNLQTLAVTLRALLNGEVATQFEDEDGDAYDVRVRLDAADRRSLDALLGIDIPSSKKDAAGRDIRIPIGQVAEFTRGSSLAQIRHMDLAREVRVFANTYGRPMGDVEADIQKALDEKVLFPPGYSARFTGDAEEMNSTFGYIYEALVLAVIFIYLILASQFGSFTHPLAIMLALPLSLIGVAVILLLTRDTLNIMSMIGLILLMGLVTKNAILLIDYANRRRREGMERTAALVEAGKTRFRPIIMTTLAMIFGMLPLAFEIGAGSELRSPMARSVIGGLITSTLLTLIVVPVAYSLLDDLTARLFKGTSKDLADKASPQVGKQGSPR